MEGAAEDVAEKDKLPLKNYAHCDSFDTVTFNYIIVLHGADTLVFVLYNTVHLNNNINIVYIYIGSESILFTHWGYRVFRETLLLARWHFMMTLKNSSFPPTVPLVSVQNPANTV